MIRYEDMPPSAQKAYRFTNKTRKVLTILSLPFFILFFVFFILNGYDFLSAFVAGSLSGYIPGLLHGEFLYKKLARTLSIIGVFLAAFISVFFLMAGFIFMFVDLILIIKKKPLIYPFENDLLLESKAAQKELAQMAYDQFIFDINNGDAMSRLQQLKNMCDQGIITQEEFEIKKAELLRRI